MLWRCRIAHLDAPQLVHVCEIELRIQLNEMRVTQLSFANALGPSTVLLHSAARCAVILAVGMSVYLP